MTNRPLNPSRPTLRPAVMFSAVACLLMVIAGCQTAADVRQQGVYAMVRGENDIAVAKLTKAVDMDASSAKSHYQLGRAYLAVGENLKAQYELEKAYALLPDDKKLTPDILDDLAESLFRQGRRANLIALIEKQVHNAPTTRDFLRQGKYFTKLGDPDAARLAYRKAAYFADPKDVVPYLAIADFYTDLGDQPNAVLALRYANYVDPGNPDVAERLRRFGIVPGPTIAEEPPKPALLR